jgi:hypothetical protein
MAKDKIEIVENIDELESPSYPKLKPNDPTISVEKSDYNLNDPNSIPRQNEELLKKAVDESYSYLAKLEIKGSLDELENEVFSFQEVDELYNEGISADEKRAWVVYLQTIMGREVSGGFKEHYPMPLISVLNIGGYKEFIGGKLDKGSYKMGDILVSGLNPNEKIQEEEHLKLKTEFDRQFARATKEWQEAVQEAKKRGFTEPSKDKFFPNKDWAYKSNSKYRFAYNVKKAEDYDIVNLLDSINALSSKTPTHFYKDITRSWDSIGQPYLKGDEHKYKHTLLKQLGNNTNELVELWEDVALNLTTAQRNRGEIERIQESQFEKVEARQYDSIEVHLSAIRKSLKDFKEGLENAMWDIFPFKVPVEVKNLMEKGVLFYDGSAELTKRFQPKFIFTSGSIYTKVAKLKGKGAEGKYSSAIIIKREFGDKVEKLHHNTLSVALEEIKSKRIGLFDPSNQGRTINLKPDSDIASNPEVFSVKRIIHPNQEVGATDVKYIEEPVVYIKENEIQWLDVQENWSGYKITQKLPQQSYAGRKNKKILKEMSLQQAFFLWLFIAGANARRYGITFKEGQTAGMVIAIYFKPKGSPKKLKEYNPDTETFNEPSLDYTTTQREIAVENAERLFAMFLEKALTDKDKERLEDTWNSDYNSLVEPDIYKVPIGFTYKKWVGTDFNLIRKEKLRAIRFWLSRGSCGLAYGVGVGKTWCANFILAQALDLGLCKKPVLILPKQVYTQYINEIQRIITKPQQKETPIIKLHNLSIDKEVKLKKLKKVDKAISVMTTQGLEAMGLDMERLVSQAETDSTYPADMGWFERQVMILESGNKTMPRNIIEKAILKALKDNKVKDIDVSQEEQVKVKKKTKVGKATIHYNQPELAFDFVICDEVHNYKKLYETVKGKPLERGTGNNLTGADPTRTMRRKNNYANLDEVSGGSDPSARAKLLFWLCRYIQTKNPFGNTLVLSATPFTNSPMEVYTMLTFIMYDYLKRSGLGYIYDFFDTYAMIGEELDNNVKMEVVKKDIFVGWVNLIGLQSLVFMAFDKTTSDEEERLVERPNKIQLPLQSTILNNIEVSPTSPKNTISTNLEMAPFQKFVFDRLMTYLNDPLEFGDPSARASADNPICMDWKWLSDHRPDDTLIADHPYYVFGDKPNLFTSGKCGKLHKTQSEDKGYWKNDLTISTQWENPDKLAKKKKRAEAQRKKLLEQGIVREVVKDTEGGTTGARAKVLRGSTYGNIIMLNPYLFMASGHKEMPTPKEYIEASPKMDYAFKCIKSLYDYERKNKMFYGLSGQVIYLNIGRSGIPLMVQYAIEYLGLEPHEVGIISGEGGYLGSDPVNKFNNGYDKKYNREKSGIAQLFNGVVYDDKTGEPSQIPHSERVKLLIGTGSISEGINLQNFATGIFNLTIDWNPTDIIQLNGRIWRQGNYFGNVRLVMPLLEDSADIFVFQKLSNKTERINMIWNKGNSVNEVDTRVFDPKEQMLSLMTDPVKLFQFKNEVDRKKVQSKLANLVSQEAQFMNYRSYYEGIKEITKKPRLRDTSFIKEMNCPIFFMYEFLKMFRPDLLEKPLISPEYLKTIDKRLNETYKCDNQYQNFEDTGNRENDQRELEKLNSCRNQTMTDEDFNYTAFELVELMDKFRTDGLIAYPKGYNPDWNQIKEEWKPLEIGDRVQWVNEFEGTTHTGKVLKILNADKQDLTELIKEFKTSEEGKKEAVFIKALKKEKRFKPYKVLVETDKGNQIPVSYSTNPEEFKILIEKKKTKKVEVKLEPFSYGTKSSFNEILKISEYQLRNSALADEGKFQFALDKKHFLPYDTEDPDDFPLSRPQAYRTLLIGMDGDRERAKNWAKPPAEQKYLWGLTMADCISGAGNFVDRDSQWLLGSCIMFGYNPDTEEVDFSISNLSTDKEIATYLKSIGLPNDDMRVSSYKEKVWNNIEYNLAVVGDKLRELMDNYKTLPQLISRFEESKGYRLLNGFFYGTSNAVYSPDFTNTIREFKIAQESDLAQLDIDTEDKLEAQILKMTENVEKVELDFRRITGEEYAKDEINRIAQEIQDRKEQGSMTPSTPENRAKEFATPIIDEDGYTYYFGNEYSQISLETELIARAKVEEALDKKGINELEFKISQMPQGKERDKEQLKLAKKKAKAVRGERKKIDYAKLEAKQPKPKPKPKAEPKPELSTDELIEALEIVMLTESEADQKKTQQQIEALELAKLVGV